MSQIEGPKARSNRDFTVPESQFCSEPALSLFLPELSGIQGKPVSHGGGNTLFVPILRAKSHTSICTTTAPSPSPMKQSIRTPRTSKKRIDQGLPWQSSAEVFSNWLQGEPVYPVYGKRAVSES